MIVRLAEYFGTTTDAVLGHCAGEPSPNGITEDEQQLIDAYRSLPAEMRPVALRVVRSMA